MAVDPVMVEIRGTGFSNIGAQLMLAAITKRLGRNQRLQFCVRPYVGSYEERARYGLYQVFDVERAGRLGKFIGLLMHSGYRRRYGLVSEKEIRAVIDASGYAIGDAWNPALVEGTAESFRRWRKEGKVVVLLPQAFGPFQNPRIRNAARDVLMNSSIVFSRDETSFGHLSELTGNSTNIEIAPDFTNLLKPKFSRKYRYLNNGVALIPNAKSEKRDGVHQYVEFFTRAAAKVKEAGLTSFVLLHELDADREVAERVQASLPYTIQIIRECDPLLVKGIVGSCKFVVCSRYHGSINALSQGVPAIGTSWGHKYGELFRGYGCENYLVETEDKQELDRCVNELLDPANLKRISVGLKSRSDSEKQRAREMWTRVEKVVHDL